MTSSRGEAPPLSLTDAGMMAYVRRPQFSPLMLARNRLAGDQDDLAWPPFNLYSPPTY
jgi:hypothetical protein